MTEDEAKTKWCPFVRHQNGSQGCGVNRVNWDKSYDYAYCIASKCMAWRVDGSKSLDKELIDAIFLKDECMVSSVKSRMNAGEQIYQHGYCGLAGKP